MRPPRAQPKASRCPAESLTLVPGDSTRGMAFTDPAGDEGRKQPDPRVAIGKDREEKHTQEVFQEPEDGCHLRRHHRSFRCGKPAKDHRGDVERQGQDQPRREEGS